MNQFTWKLSTGKKVFFASDFHLGSPDFKSSIEREKKIIKWLDSIKHEAETIFLVGDLFDFWFEFCRVIPKGFTRLQGKLAELSDSGINIAVFPGNHDRWIDGYFENEIGITLYRKPQSFIINEKIFYIAHGDGLGPGDIYYKLLNNLVFKNRMLQFIFRRIIPNFGMWAGTVWSRASFPAEGTYPKKFDEETEMLISYSKKIEASVHHDYYIFGHRHLAYKFAINENSFCINLGEWINECDYVVFDGNDVELKKFTPAILDN